jgi:hypothetical protein
MQINVINRDYATVMDEDGVFRCEHKDFNIEPPCCNGNNCDCWGQDTVFCNDCQNQDLEDWEAQDILEREF